MTIFKWNLDWDLKGEQETRDFMREHDCKLKRDQERLNLLSSSSTNMLSNLIEQKPCSINSPFADPDLAEKQNWRWAAAEYEKRRKY